MPSHRRLKSVVTSVAQSFTSLLNYRDDDYVMGHIVAAAWASGSTGFQVDLLSGETDSSPILVPPVRNSIADYVQRLPDIVQRSRSSMEFVTAAELRVQVDPTNRRATSYDGLLESPFTCTVRIVDDRGRVYSYKIEGWWFPETAHAGPRKQKGWNLLRRLTMRCSRRGPAARAADRWR